MRPPSIFATLCLLLCATSALPGAEGTPALGGGELGTTSRVHQFGTTLLASQPGQADLALARERGIRTLINLRLPAEPIGFDERAEAERLGLEYHNVPWNGSAEQAEQTFGEIRRLLNDTEQPVLLHCGSGNRVGAAWIPWRVLDGGLDVEAAVAEAKTIGLVSPEFEQQAREYVQRQQAAR